MNDVSNPSSKTAARRAIHWSTLLGKLGPVAGLLFVVALFAFLRPRTFLTADNFQIMLEQTAVVGVAALGMTLIIISGGIDLSIQYRALHRRDRPHARERRASHHCRARRNRRRRRLRRADRLAHHPPSSHAFHRHPGHVGRLAWSGQGSGAGNDGLRAFNLAQ